MKPFPLLTIMLLLGVVTAHSREVADTAAVEVIRPVTAAYTVEAGSARLVDTYLSPIRYKGWHTALGYERWQAMRHNPRQMVMRLRGTLNVERTTNVVGNATMWGASLDLQWAMMWRKPLLPGLTVGIGPGLTLDAGCLYTSRNGNNPVAAKGAVTVDAAAYAAYNRSFFGLPVTFSYSVDMPVAGAFFAPDYGELYYEIYLGNTSGLAHFAWPGNRFELDNRLTADIRFGGTSLRLGYRLDLFGSSVNHITTRRLTHSAIIGISGEWMSLNPRHRLSEKTRVFSALF